MKRSILVLLSAFLAIQALGQTSPAMASLLQHLSAEPASFKKFAMGELQLRLVSLSFVEGGLIGEEEYRGAGFTLVKSYGYYALRHSPDRAVRRRLGPVHNKHTAWRDSTWNDRRERDWTALTLLTEKDSIVQALLAATLSLGVREVQPCLRTTKVNDVAVEEKMFALGNAYVIVFRKYFYPDIIKHEVKLSLCSSD